MLGREPVADRCDDDSRTLRDRARRPVVGLDAAGDPAAAVEVDEGQARLVGLDRTVDPDRHPVRIDVLDGMHLVELTPLLLAQPDVLRTQLVHAHRPRRLHARSSLLLEHGLDLRVEHGRRHGARFYVGGVSRSGASNGP